MRVTPSGNPGAPFVISNNTDRQAHPDVLFDGTNFIIVYADEGYTNQAICGARVTPAGNVLDPNGKLLISGSEGYSLPKISSDGTNLMLVYKNNVLTTGYIYGQRLSTSLEKIGSSFTVSSSTNRKDDLRISFDGNNYLVAWIERETYFTSRILCRIVTPQGNIPGGEITIVSGISYQSASFDLCFTGTNYFLVYSNGTSLKGQYISPSGQLVGSSFTIASSTNGISTPALCWVNGNFLLTYSKNNSTDYDIYGNTEIINVNENILSPPAFKKEKATFISEWFPLKKGEQLYDKSGRRITNPGSSGIYFIRYKEGTQIKIRKVIYLK
ncbi:MAG TPA: hypothetical protein ENI34_01045 [candidate division WOR-3 bacterium]|uniref:Uncharacterized protein n=1 Tax=candidate division WOR-3 bacterium TaxID=2052148 RepID=A0A9C9JZE7_UNCW3|nr:hypothetical protein [candidate division WOR-3 bacterium]